MQLCVHFLRLIAVVGRLEVMKVDTWRPGIQLARAGDGSGSWRWQIERCGWNWTVFWKEKHELCDRLKGLWWRGQDPSCLPPELLCAEKRVFLERWLGKVWHWRCRETAKPLPAYSVDNYPGSFVFYTEASMLSVLQFPSLCMNTYKMSKEQVPGSKVRK